MGTYTVAITPDVAGGAQATVRVDIHEGVARVVEVVVRPPSGGAVSEDQLSAMDFELLLRAVHPAVTAVHAMSEAAGAPNPTEAAPSLTARTVTRRTRTAKSTPSARIATLDARVYRRMPDDLVETFAKIGSVTQLAKHYRVPRHTAQGWINRLRRQVA